MAASLIQLTAPLDKATVLADLYTLGGYFGLPVPAMQVGEPIPTVLAKVVEWFVDDLWNPNVVPALRAPFLDWATGDWLTIIAGAIYNRPRIGAQSGTGPIDIENRSTVSGTVTIAVGSIRVKHATTGATYTNTTASSVLQYSGSGLFPHAIPTMTFEADVVGTASNALGSTIASFPVPPTTSPSVGLYALTNGNPILGSDEETDERLVVRCRAAAGALSPGGPRDAYYDAATDPLGAFTRRGKTPPSTWGTTAPAISRVLVQDTGNATVLVSLASTSGPAGGNNVTVDTDVFKANTAIQMFVVPPGITATVAPAVLQNLNLGTITLSITAESRVTAAEAIATATTALDLFFSTLAIGGARKIAGGQGYVYANKVFGVVEAGAGDITADIPALSGGDVVVGGNAVIVLSPPYTMAANIVPQGT